MVLYITVQYMIISGRMTLSNRPNINTGRVTVGRPKEFDRDRAVITVMNEIWEHGYEACSAKALSEKLGITRSSFYNAFESREKLFLEVLEIYNGPAPFRAWFPIDETSSVLKVISEKLHNICKTRISDNSARGCLLINSIAELVSRNKQLGSALQDTFSTNVEYLEQLLNVAAERREIEKCDLHIKALALQNVLIGLNVMSKVIRDEDELWAATKHSLQGLGLYSE